MERPPLARGRVPCSPEAVPPVDRPPLARGRVPVSSAGALHDATNGVAAMRTATTPAAPRVAICRAIVLVNISAPGKSIAL